MNVAVIPARGGSRRIPRKNIRKFAGKPMLAHSIDCASETGLFDRIIVSTDDDEIAELARSHGADVPFTRPRELATDHSGTTEVIAHAVEWLRSHGEDPAAVCCIYATAPFMLAADVAAASTVLESGSWQYVFAATSYVYPVFRSFELDSSGGVKMFFPEHFTSRSQDLPEALHDAGQFCWGRPDAWVSQLRVFDSHSTVVRIPHWRVQDIDTPEDWERAELMWRTLAAGGA